MSSTSNEPVYVSDIAPMVKDQALSPHPYGLDWEQHLADIQSLTLHHNDVIICAYPKAVSFGDYVRYLQQMETFMKENPDHPVVNVSFEETKRDPVGVVRRLAELMQVDASEKLCEDIAVACSFQKMKMFAMNEKSNGPENIRTFLVKDQVLPPQPFGLDWEQQVVNIQSMKVRDDDLIICAYPKAGTHWLWEMCHMLLHGRVEYETRAKEHLMMEFVSKDALANDDSPRIFNTHLYFSLFMTEKMKEKKVKLVHVYRNPKDTVMSLYFHYRQLLWHSQDLREFVQEFLRGEVSFGDYVRYLQQMETFMKENPDHPVVNVSFEETKRDPVGVVRRLAELMKVDASEKLCEDIVAACSFQKMKMVDDTLKQYLQTPLITFSQKLYRKGKDQMSDVTNDMRIEGYKQRLSKNHMFVKSIQGY
ncbi:hypothetical protein C0Q70_06947 [Pomacea canaliculata]|uniref:Sulfotransferase domain-containing protein n=1 Tax=Pomacea canaliculata TaxID=400727 RepID=A0A2T7PDP1_POMCA|nr:hypothetical protein C0Q70_06947 [Pomacea canaliculata]